MFFFRFLLLFLLWTASAAAERFEGLVTVIDGDTLDVGTVRVRLHGIDAVEKDQTCISAAGQSWPCGTWVIGQTVALFQGKTATCTRLDTDRYGRAVARCMVGGQDVGDVLVSAGLAQAYRRYSMDYDLAEKTAQVQGLGLWSSSTLAPAEFRAQGTSDEVPPPSADCVIKGNISSSGRIYHVPGQENYADTRINTGSGERWFCSEAEARAAGWRPARR